MHYSLHSFFQVKRSRNKFPRQCVKKKALVLIQYMPVLALTFPQKDLMLSANQ